LKRRVVLLDGAPDHHAAMFMMLTGRRTAIVGDPVEGRRLWATLDAAARESLALPGGPDFSDATTARFEAVVRRCREAGYRVVRIPTVVASDGRTYLTYVNVLIDVRGGSPTVYMPVYRGAAELNQRAAATWGSLGYQVEPVDCTDCFRHYGTLHCLVNVLRRGS
jgi:hypothetical protein